MDSRNELKKNIDALKESIEKHRTGAAELSSESIADLAKAIHDLSDHVLNLHERIEKVEETQHEWTTRGWTAPPGSDRPS